MMIQVRMIRETSALNGAAPQKQSQSGLTVLEILLALAIAAALLAIAVPSYQRYITRAKNAQAMADIADIGTLIVRFYADSNGRVPDTLADVGMENRRDPWDRPYRFLNLSTLKGKGAARKDKSLVPINSDFDLYSVGADGASVVALTSKVSRDDIVRANNGRFIGLAEDY